MPMDNFPHLTREEEYNMLGRPPPLSQVQFKEAQTRKGKA